MGEEVARFIRFCHNVGKTYKGWFLKIDSVQIVGMRARVCVCVCARGY